MAVSLSSDIISDVARAVTPADYRAATQRLAEGSGSIDTAGFERSLSSAAKIAVSPLARRDFDAYAARTNMRSGVQRVNSERSEQVFQQFEALVIQTFIESMLPRSDGAFGEGSSGSVWRSILAEQISAQVARAGGVGITKTFLGSRATVDPSV